MTCTIHISHPNDLNRLRIVDRFDNASDLASPVFDWNPYDVIRVTEQELTIYTGFFTHSECVDVGPSSKVMMELMHPFSASNSASLVDIWNYQFDSTKILMKLSKYITAETILKNTFSCIRLALNDCRLNNEHIADVLDFIQLNAYNMSAVDERDFGSDLRRIIEEHNYTCLGYCASVIYRLLLALPSRARGRADSVLNYIILLDDISNAVASAKSIGRLRAKVIVMQKVKENISFREILAGIEKS